MLSQSHLVVIPVGYYLVNALNNRYKNVLVSAYRVCLVTNSIRILVLYGEAIFF